MIERQQIKCPQNPNKIVELNTNIVEQRGGRGNALLGIIRGKIICTTASLEHCKIYTFQFQLEKPI